MPSLLPAAEVPPPSLAIGARSSRTQLASCLPPGRLVCPPPSPAGGAPPLLPAICTPHDDAVTGIPLVSPPVGVRPAMPTAEVPPHPPTNLVPFLLGSARTPHPPPLSDAPGVSLAPWSGNVPRSPPRPRVVPPVPAAGVSRFPAAVALQQTSLAPSPSPLSAAPGVSPASWAGGAEPSPSPPGASLPSQWPACSALVPRSLCSDLPWPLTGTRPLSCSRSPPLLGGWRATPPSDGSRAAAPRSSRRATSPASCCAAEPHGRRPEPPSARH